MTDRPDLSKLGTQQELRDAIEKWWAIFAEEERNDVGQSTLLRVVARKAFEKAYVLGRLDELEQWESARPQFEDGQP